MAKQVVLICDLCGAQGASTVAIEADDSRVKTDLCDEHIAPIRGILDQVAHRKDGPVNFAEVKDDLDL